MTAFRSFVSALAHELRSQTTAILCGAGISRHSGLPVVNQLVPLVLETLNVPEDSIRRITESSLPFEAFVETVRNVCDTDLLLDIFRLGEPNTNHVLLAKLVKKGILNTICTTNFDTLIERALEDEGLHSGDDYQVFSREDDFDKIPWDSSVARLIKIHGSIEDKESVAITLRQVASRRLSVHRQGVINGLFSGRHRRLLVLGYSCSDLFDVSPHIEAVEQSSIRVALVDHSSGKPTTIADIREKKDKNPFGMFADSVWVRADTDDLVKILCDELLDDGYRPPDQIQQRTDWRELVAKWGDRVEQQAAPGSKYRIAGRLLDRVSQSEDAIQMYEKALRAATDSGDLIAEAWIRGDMGAAHQNLGNYHYAAEGYQRALELAGAAVIDTGEIHDDQWRYYPPNKKEQGAWMGNLGTVYDQLGDGKRAKENIEAALKIAQECGDEQREVSWLGNLGVVLQRLGDIERSLDHYERAVFRAAEIGDKEGESIWNGNLGKALHDLGKYASALAPYERALVIARQIGDRRREGIWLGGRGKARLRLDQREGALRDLEDALDIARETGDRENEGHWQANLGNAFLSDREYGKARERYDRALELFESIGARNHSASVRGNLAVTLVKIGDFSSAIDALSRCASEMRQVGDRIGEGTAVGNLGNVYLSLGDHLNAVDNFDLALSILTPILGEEHPTVKLFDKNWSLSMKQRLLGGYGSGGGGHSAL